MKFINVRELSSKTTKILNEDIKEGKKVIVTKRGKPIAFIIPFEEKLFWLKILLDEASNLLKSSKISEEEALKLLEELRKKIYGKNSD